jgi:hypothetical protein
MRVIRAVESESDVRELNLAVAGNHKNCGFCGKMVPPKMGRWVNMDYGPWEMLGSTCHVAVEQNRAVQRSHRAATLMDMMLWHACARQNAFLVSQWHETRRTRKLCPTCLLRARGVPP